MLKYQKKGLCKTLSMLLAVVMLLTAPIGTTQAYALEGEQPTVTDVQGEMPLDTSEEAETNGILDSGEPLETPATPSEALASPAFAEDYPKLGVAQTEGSKKVEVLAKGILPEGETLMGLGYVLLADNDSAPTATQIRSADGKIPGVTIITWAQQSLGDTETTITLTGAQDDTDYDFYAVCWKGDTFSEVKHLDVKTPAAEITSDVETGAGASVTGVHPASSTSTTIKVSSELELINHLNSAQSGDTIQLTTDIMRSETNSSGNSPALIIKGKKITLDLNGYNLSIYNVGYGPGLRLEPPSTNERNATQLHVTGGGKLTISAKHVGLSVDRSKFSSDASVAVDINGNFTVGIGGMLADVDIQKGSVTGSDGISLSYNSYLTVKGPIKATVNVGINLSNSIYLDQGCTIHVGSIEAKGRGISMDGGEVTVDGTITAPTYIQFKDTIPTTIDDYLPKTTLPGYRTYQYETSGTVWVKGEASSDIVCEIDSTKYATLDAALEAVQSGETIKLLQDVDYPKGIVIIGEHIIFDVGSYKLNITNSSGSGLDVSGTAGRVSLSATTGELNVTGTDYGVRAWGGGAVTVTNATATAAGGNGIFASNPDTDVTVNSNVKGISTGIYVIDKANVLVKGDVTGDAGGAYASGSGSAVIVRGKTTAATGIGVFAEGGGNILAHGAIEAVTCGARISNGGTITVKKEITATGADGVGAWLTGGGSGGGLMTIDGDITATNYINLSGTIKLKTDGMADSSKPGYTKYTDGDDRVVWVKAISYTDITSSFTDPKFLAAVRSKLGKGGSDPIYTADVAGITDLGIVGKGITNLAGIEYFTGLTTLDCSNNALKTLDVSHLTKLVNLYCSDNLLTGLDVSSLPKLTELLCFDNLLTWLVLNSRANYSNIDARNNYMENENAVTGKNITWDDYRFRFSPQKAPQTTYPLTVQSGTGGGNYIKDSTVTIIANSAPAGQRFKEWEFSPTVTFTGGTSKIDATAKFIMPAQAVTATATYEALPASHYTIIVQSDGNGTASASVNSAAQGTEITLTATPNSNHRFKEWQVVSGGVSIVNNKLIMPGADITVKAIFEPIPTASVTVTFNLNGGTRTGGGELTQTITSDSSVIAPTVTRGGYTFIGWDKAFTKVTSSLTVTANWSRNGGSSGGGSGGSSNSGSSTVITTTPGKTPDQPVIAAASVTATAGANGAASAVITEKSVTDAIAKAQADTMAQGKTANGIEVKLNVTMPKGATSLTTTLTSSSLNSLVSAGVSSLTINGSPVAVCFDQKALAEIQKQSSGDVTITIKPAQNLSAAAKRLIGTRPVYDITVSYVKDGKATVVSSFNGGIATISIPYKPDKNEAAGYLCGVYADEKGNATRIEGSAYDANTGAILIPTGHLSVYGVGYTAPSAKFKDIATHWGKESIDYVVGRGLLSGTSETTFAPNTAMTRGMLVTALGRLAGVDVKAYTTNSFTDVKADSAFLPYIEWAYKKGVVQGIGNQQFAPDRSITREEIAVIFANYAKATGYKLPVTSEASTYADASSIGSVYKTAVTAMQQAGIMMGGTGNKFSPKSSTTRAEVSAMLHRYIKLTIDPSTAQGWAKNGTEQYLYYKDGKALTGTQTIDGAIYFFNTDGTLKTGWVKDGDNWRYYSGNKANVGWLDISNKQYYFTKDGLMVSGKWLHNNSKWYYFYVDGSLAKNTKVDGYEVGPDGVRKTK